MKRNYKYEREMLHWLDGGDIEQRYIYDTKWYPFEGAWGKEPDWEYRIAEPDLSRNVLIGLTTAEKPKEERWLYVYSTPNGEAFSRASPCHIGTVSPHLMGCESIGKIRLEDI